MFLFINPEHRTFLQVFIFLTTWICTKFIAVTTILTQGVLIYVFRVVKSTHSHAETHNKCSWFIRVRALSYMKVDPTDLSHFWLVRWYHSHFKMYKWRATCLRSSVLHRELRFLKESWINFHVPIAKKLWKQENESQASSVHWKIVIPPVAKDLG